MISIKDKIRELSEKSGTVSVDLCDLRTALPDWSRDELDHQLIVMGTAWEIELRAVHDMTRLTSDQKAGLLILPDGTPVVSVALGDEAEE